MNKEAASRLWRRRTYQLFENPYSSRINQIINQGVMLLITLNIIAIIFESVDSIYAKWGVWFQWFELISVILFTIEYIARVWSSIEATDDKNQSPIKARLRYMMTPMALIDLLSILPYYLTVFLSVDLRFMRMLRLLRIFKLTRYSSSMEILLTVFRDEAKSFGSAFFILIMVLVISASGIYLFENDAQPDAFGSIPQSLWWAIATLTTVGYGDVSPITAGGKLFGSAVMIVGIGIVALPTGILASAFAEELRSRRQAYDEKLSEALADGFIDQNEQLTLDILRKELNISDNDAKQIMREVELRHAPNHAKKAQEKHNCPNCGYYLD